MRQPTAEMESECGKRSIAFIAAATAPCFASTLAMPESSGQSITRSSVWSDLSAGSSHLGVFPPSSSSPNVVMSCREPP